VFRPKRARVGNVEQWPNRGPCRGEICVELSERFARSDGQIDGSIILNAKITDALIAVFAAAGGTMGWVVFFIFTIVSAKKKKKK